MFGHHTEKNIALHSKSTPPYLFGKRISYVDLSICYLLDGLEHAFPNNFRKATANTPRLLALRKAVRMEQSVVEYLDSEKRLPFSNGIFRHYPEADQ